MNKYNNIAIVVVAYNREKSLLRLLDSLLEADYPNINVPLIISIDRSENNNIEKIAKSIVWPFGDKIVRTHKNKMGLKKHIISIGELLNDYDAIIVLEDDILVSKSYYKYAQASYEFYKDDDQIAGISLYNFQKHWLNRLSRFEPEYSDYDTYFLKVAQSWGQIWMKKQWKDFKLWLNNNPLIPNDDSIPYTIREWPDSSWLKYHHLFCIKNDKYFVYPYKSFSTNMGDIGTHAKNINTDYQVELVRNKNYFRFQKLQESKYKYNEFMEREKIVECFPMYKGNLTVDLYNSKNIKFKTRYVLTTKILNFKIIESYALSIRPIELNVFLNIHGEGIYLYDLKYPNVNKKRRNSFLRYSIRTSDYLSLFLFSSTQLISKITNKIGEIIKK